MRLLRQHTEYLQKCFACGRVGNDMYSCQVNGKNYLVCSTAHGLALEAEVNKKKI